MKKVHIGIDAHKATNLLAYAFGGREAPELIDRVTAERLGLGTRRAAGQAGRLRNGLPRICWKTERPSARGRN